MSKAKSGKPEDPQGRIEDPEFLREAFQQLFDGETEFPIRVEGTHTLPYFATIQSLAWETGSMVLKLVRPLPHELLLGAVFHFLCASGEQRYEGFLVYRGRVGYLQYAFEPPTFLTLSDRRMHRRHPFRPRESAYVVLQDTGIPGLGVAGPLVNIGLGGLALRVDRIIRLDTGVRVPPATALFERGKGFTRVRIQDLPRLHLLETRGLAAHAHERGQEVILGLHLTGLEPEEEAALQNALDIRERSMRGAAGVKVEGGAVALRDGEARPAEAETPGAAPEVAWDLQMALRRRSCLAALVAAAGVERDALEARLREAGFHRLLVAGSLEDLAATVAAEPRRKPPRVALVDISMAHAGDAEPLEAVRTIEAALAEMGRISPVILTETVDPTLLLSQAEDTRYLPPDLGPEGLAALDGMLEAG
jgi:hypothetical protein